MADLSTPLLVSLVHGVRKELLKSDHFPVDSSGDSEREVEVILERLLNLESFLDGYEDVEMVQQLKDNIAKHVSSPDMGSENALNDAEVAGDVSVHSFRNGLGPIRKAFLGELTESISGVTQEMILSNTLYETGGNSSKKQKAGGSLFSSFNFDDLQDFEPLEVVLRQLRDDPNSQEGIQKLMTIDAAELIEHSQWPEVVELMARAIVKASSDADKLSILALHARLMHSLTGQQSIDISTNLLKHLWRKWGRWKSMSSPDHTVGPSSHAAGTIAFSNVERMEVACFCFLVENCRSNLEYCTEASAESIVTVLFLLMASGYVPVELGAGGKQGTFYLQILDAVTLSERKSIIEKSMELLRCIKPISAAAYAVNTTLVKTLITRLKGRSETVSTSEKCTDWQFRSEILDLGLILTLLAPLNPFHAESLFVKAMGGDTLWLWDGTEHSSDEAHRGAISNEGLPTSYPLPSLNKLFHQLSGSQAMIGEEGVGGGDLASSSAAPGERQMGQFFHLASELMFTCMTLASKPALSSLTQIVYKVYGLLLLLSSRCGSHEVLLPSWKVCCDHLARCPNEGAAVLDAYLSALQPLFHEGASILTPLTKLWVGIASSDYVGSALREEGDASLPLKHRLFSSWEKLLCSLYGQLPHEQPETIAKTGVVLEDRGSSECMRMLTECALISAQGESYHPIPLFLARIATMPISVQAQVLTEDLWHRLTDSMITHFMDCTEAAHPCNVFHLELVMRGVLSALLRPGGRELPDPSFGRIVECFKKECESVDVYESSFSQDCSSPLALLLHLLIAVSSFGHATLALRILRAAFVPLDEFMSNKEVEGTAALIVCLLEDRYSLSCESFHPALLRVMDAALSHPVMAAEVATLLDDKGVEAGEQGLGIEEMFASTAGKRVIQARQGNPPPFIEFDSQILLSVPLQTPLGFLENR